MLVHTTMPLLTSGDSHTLSPGGQFFPLKEESPHLQPLALGILPVAWVHTFLLLLSLVELLPVCVALFSLSPEPAQAPQDLLPAAHWDTLSPCSRLGHSEPLAGPHPSPLHRDPDFAKGCRTSSPPHTVLLELSLSFQDLSDPAGGPMRSGQVGSLSLLFLQRDAVSLTH